VAQLKLRELSRPLAEARKDPGIQEAALFVERMYGRPLKSNPDVVTVTPENKARYLECVKQDFPKRGLVFMPLSFMLSEEKKHRAIKELLDWDIVDEAIVFELKDFLRPAEVRRRCGMMDFTSTCKRYKLEEIVGIDRRTPYQKLKMGLVGGIHLTKENIVVSSGDALPILVHELVHSEDNVTLGPVAGKISRTILEGRATFGERLFVLIGQGKYGKPRDIEAEHLPTLIRRLIENAPRTIPESVREQGVFRTIASLSKFLAASISGMNIATQRYYLPYAITLFEVSRAVGNAFTAFQMATQKPPTTAKEMRNSLEFYRQEIEKHANAAIFSLS